MLSRTGKGSSTLYSILGVLGLEEVPSWTAEALLTCMFAPQPSTNHHTPLTLHAVHCLDDTSPKNTHQLLITTAVTSTPHPHHECCRKDAPQLLSTAAQQSQPSPTLPKTTTHIINHIQTPHRSLTLHAVDCLNDTSPKDAPQLLITTDLFGVDTEQGRLAQRPSATWPTAAAAACTCSRCCCCWRHVELFQQLVDIIFCTAATGQ
jgi:hypothetical protein